MKKTILYLCILLFFLSTEMFSDEKKEPNPLEIKIQKLEKKLKTIEELYWKKKYDFIEIKKKSKEEMEYLEGEYEDIVSQKNSLKEDLLRRQSENKELKSEVEMFELRIQEIYSMNIDKINRIMQFVESKYPFTKQEDLKYLSELKDDIERKKGFIKVSTDILEYSFKQIKRSSEFELTHSKVLTNDNMPIMAEKLRGGFIFYDYLSDDKTKSGLVLHNDKISSQTYRWYEELSEKIKENIKNAIIEIHSESKFVHLPMDMMQSKVVGKYSLKQGTILYKLTEWFKSGGIVMYAILFILVYSIFIIINRLFVYARNHLRSDKLMKKIINYITENKIDEAKKLCKKKRGSLPRILLELFETAGKTKDDSLNKIQEVLLHEIPVIERHLPTLKSLGALAPLLGLLGTVTGMITLFDVITVFGTGDPKLLAGGISEALVTTEFGLIVAIPTTILHRILLNRANRFINDIERYSLSVVNKLQF